MSLRARRAERRCWIGATRNMGSRCPLCRAKVARGVAPRDKKLGDWPYGRIPVHSILKTQHHLTGEPPRRARESFDTGQSCAAACCGAEATVFPLRNPDFGT